MSVETLIDNFVKERMKADFNKLPDLSPKDFASDQDVSLCPGCGGINTFKTSFQNAMQY